MRAMRFLVGLAAAVAGACVPDPDVGVASDTQSILGDPCPKDGCGDPNSPVIDGVYFWRLHLGGLPNPEGVRIIAVDHDISPGMQLELVDGDRLQGRIGSTLLAHLDLISTKIRVLVPVEGQAQAYEIIISSVAPNVPISEATEWFWVRDPDLPGPEIPIEAYDFSYRRFEPDPDPDPGHDNVARPLCAEGDGDPEKLRALVFGGDLYNPVTKAIVVGPETDGWINIACADSAIYKMHKIGYTSAAQAKEGIPRTKIHQRRAMLNAWTANVCGTGEAFTEQGELITLRESLGMLLPGSGYLDPSETYEAIWDHNGAVCLDVPRREDDDPKIFQKIEKECQLPRSCGQMIANWKQHGHVLTGNPAPAP